MRARFAVEIREPTAGFFDDDLHRRHVPMRDLRLDRNLRRSLGHEHVRPEVAEAARASASADEIEKPPADPEMLESGNVVVAELRAVDVINRRNVDRCPVAERSFAARGPPSPSQRRSKTTPTKPSSAMSVAKTGMPRT